MGKPRDWIRDNTFGLMTTIPLVGNAATDVFNTAIGNPPSLDQLGTYGVLIPYAAGGNLFNRYVNTGETPRSVLKKAKDRVAAWVERYPTTTDAGLAALLAPPAFEAIVMASGVDGGTSFEGRAAWYAFSGSYFTGILHARERIRNWASRNSTPAPAGEENRI